MDSVLAGAGKPGAVASTAVARKRPYGTGHLYLRRNSRGGETWYGQIRVDGRRVKRALGPKRDSSTPDGLTQGEAEQKLRRLIDNDRPPPRERVSVAEAGELLIAHLATLGRKPSTLQNYESYLRIHLAPFFGKRPLDRITPGQIQRFIAVKIASGRSPKSVMNWVGFLHSIFAFAKRRDLASSNPCKLVDKPRVTSSDGRIR